MPKVVIVGEMTFGESGLPSPPPSGGEFPSQGLPGRPARPGQLPSRPGRPVDPDWGVEEGTGEPPQVWPIPPDGGGLPPIAGQPLPPANPPPGTIWPPLPPSIPPGKTLVYAGIAGVGHRYIVVEIPPPKPGQGLPGHPEHKPVEPDEPSPEPHNRRR